MIYNLFQRKGSKKRVKILALKFYTACQLVIFAICPISSLS
ncbi:hypothetical protein CY0110_18132 [Crocosphaera chwakensis CCY0110]|uniref:Uncharacterized protein n=1 Tax=Crocosphaera chwakensis CCY0110 TaxID=391612 RepID=A3IIV8_9CHRO|nr:hypothetical protein CY0110_18132 [Crocosphaera chwakensis CCY0110]